MASAALTFIGVNPILAEPDAASTDTETRAEAQEGSGPKSRNATIERWRAATPGERREMRANLRERWRDASPRERRKLKRRLHRLERALPDMSAIERMMLLRAAAELPEAERKALRKRVARIDDLSPEDRRAFVAELEEMIREVEPEVERLERNRSRWKGMSDAERSEYRAQMKKLRAMTPEERKALFEEMDRNRAR